MPSGIHAAPRIDARNTPTPARKTNGQGGHRDAIQCFSGRMPKPPRNPVPGSERTLRRRVEGDSRHRSCILVAGSETPCQSAFGRHKAWKEAIDPRERRLFFPHLKKFSLSFGELPFDHVQAVGASQTQFGSHAGKPGSSLKRVGKELLEVSGRTHAVRGERQVRYRQSFIGAEITTVLQ